MSFDALHLKYNFRHGMTEPGNGYLHISSQGFRYF